MAEVYFRNTGKRMYGWPGGWLSGLLCLRPREDLMQHHRMEMLVLQRRIRQERARLLTCGSTPSW